jgi:DNA-binding transcriptional MerR regulator
MKPDVLKQIDEILEERRKEMEKEQAKNVKIVLQRPGEAPIEISPAQAVEMMKAQQQEIAKRDARIAELEKIIQKLLNPVPVLAPAPAPPPSPIISKTNPINKGEPMFKISDLQKN